MYSFLKPENLFGLGRHQAPSFGARGGCGAPRASAYAQGRVGSLHQFVAAGGDRVIGTKAGAPHRMLDYLYAHEATGMFACRIMVRVVATELPVVFSHSRPILKLLVMPGGMGIVLRFVPFWVKAISKANPPSPNVS